MAQIHKLCTISGNRDWYVIFNDTDSSTDYFNSVSGSQKSMAEYIKKYGAEHIGVTLMNGREVDEKDIKGVKRLAKKTGYVFELKEEERIAFDGTKWVEIYGTLKKEVRK